MIMIRKAADNGMLGFQCGPEVRCADCTTTMHGLVWIAERLVAMHHDEPVVELLCLTCARKAKNLIKGDK